MARRFAKCRLGIVYLFIKFFSHFFDIHPARSHLQHRAYSQASNQSRSKIARKKIAVSFIHQYPFPQTRTNSTPQTPKLSINIPLCPPLYIPVLLHLPSTTNSSTIPSFIPIRKPSEIQRRHALICRNCWSRPRFPVLCEILCV